MIRNEGFVAPGSDKKNTYGYQQLPHVLVLELEDDLEYDDELDLVEAPTGEERPFLVQYSLVSVLCAQPNRTNGGRSLCKAHIRQKDKTWACFHAGTCSFRGPDPYPAPNVLIYVRKDLGRIDIRPPDGITPQDFWKGTSPVSTVKKDVKEKTASPKKAPGPKREAPGLQRLNAPGTSRSDPTVPIVDGAGYPQVPIAAQPIPVVMMPAAFDPAGLSPTGLP
jgi:hypothetical protein